MTTAPGGLTDWQHVSVQLTADAPTQILSFLAWGDDGNNINLPPIVFLTGFDAPRISLRRSQRHYPSWAWAFWVLRPSGVDA